MGDASLPNRWSQRGSRPVRIANCSGARGDPGSKMLEQATLGDVDFITGDYLAEMNLAENAEAMAAGKHDGWEPCAWDGLQLTLETLDQKRIKVVIDGGALNPDGLARKTQALVNEKGLNLKVACVCGDNLVDEIREVMKKGDVPGHLDSENSQIKLQAHAKDFLDIKTKPIVSANAYLGARAIVKGLEMGADVM